MDLNLRGKKAFIAGGSRGIGKAIASVLADEGAEIVIAARSLKRLEDTANEISSKSKTKVIPMSFDVADKGSVDSAIKNAHSVLNGLDILVNSAAIPNGSPAAIRPIDSLDEDALIGDFNIKYVGALRCSRAALPYMQEQRWGRIINISGLNARKAGNLSGGARNVALMHLTRSLAMQFGRYGINVNCIYPGVTRTERTPEVMAERAKKIGISAEELEKQDFDPNSPIGNFICRMVDAEEIGNVVAFLSSDKAAAITGDVITTDGGNGASIFY